MFVYKEKIRLYVGIAGGKRARLLVIQYGLAETIGAETGIAEIEKHGAVAKAARDDFFVIRDCRIV